ncbi:MAG: hypothetical protein A2X86_02170 [Bdellovibrionales bacterium GWA2_49_15]|nr:MAG: hypothetical protein A2X86_02170 [Bdellovibrionales bacterium GWA2_49_15]
MDDRIFKYKTKKISLTVKIIPMPDYRSGPKERGHNTTDARKINQGTLGHYGLVIRSVCKAPAINNGIERPDYLEHYFPSILLPTEQGAQDENLLHIIKGHILPNLLRYWDLALQ